MLKILGNQTYRNLFAAQVIALVGTGLLTVALSLLAYELAGSNAGVVLGTALAIKMGAYIVLAPIAQAFAARLPRRGFLIAMDCVRAAAALALPFITQIWQIYLLIFILQAASAAFTPTFQAVIPDILPDEKEYTNALTLSRLAYDLETLFSPALAGLLLTLISFHWLFAGTAVGFIVSALFVLPVQIPNTATAAANIWQRITQGIVVYLATPRLRGLLALNLAVAAAGAMVFVNTVVIVRDLLGGNEREVAVTLAFFGGGSMIAALAISRILDRYGDRAVMLTAAVFLCVVQLLFIFVTQAVGIPSWTLILTGWALIGASYSAVLIPSGRLTRRSAESSARPSLFAAQFSLSHVCWLITYPLAGWAVARFGLPTSFLILGGIAFIATAAAMMLWRDEKTTIAHAHPDLPSDHPHLREHGRSDKHEHVFYIDQLHRRWPA
jgi:MFS family permease